jgi:hypothetical protein
MYVMYTIKNAYTSKIDSDFNYNYKKIEGRMKKNENNKDGGSECAISIEETLGQASVTESEYG